MTSYLRATAVFVFAVLFLAPDLLLARSDDVARPVVSREDIARSLPFQYTIPARGDTPGCLRARLMLSTYNLSSSVSPSTEIAGEQNVLTTRFHLSFALSERLGFWVEPELRRLRWRFGSGEEIGETAWADTWFGLRLSPPANESLLRLGVAGMVLVPTGASNTDGRAGDFTTGVTDYAVIGLCDLDLSRFFASGRCVLYINCGYRWHGDEISGSRVWPDVYPPVIAGRDANFNDVMLLRVGWRYARARLVLEAEIRGDRFVHAGDRMTWRENPVAASAAVRRWLGRRTWMRFGGEVAVSSGGSGVDDLPDPERSFPDWVMFLSAGTQFDLLQ